MTNESLTVVTVDVTQEDIDEAWGHWVDGYRKATRIMLAAIKRVLSESAKVENVTCTYIRVDGITCHLPVSAKEFCSATYVGKFREPFTFTLSLPTAALRQSAIPAQETPDASFANHL